MADEKQAEQEQSMEEILASIRKIISEDDRGDDASAAADADDDDDILDLSDPLPDVATTAAETEPVPAMAPAAKPAADTMAGDDGDEGDDGDDELIVVEDEAAKSGSDPAAAAPAAASTAAPAPMPPATATNEGLLSPAAAALSAAALSSLRSSGVRGDMTVGAGGNTVESLVTEMLRPMLKQWLDTHLPSVVENLVRAEIQRLTGERRD